MEIDRKQVQFITKKAVQILKKQAKEAAVKKIKALIEATDLSRGNKTRVLDVIKGFIQRFCQLVPFKVMEYRCIDIYIAHVVENSMKYAYMYVCVCVSLFTPL